jgi:hypothetical protein
MDELTLFTGLKPPPPPAQGESLSRVRARLDAAVTGAGGATGAGTRTGAVPAPWGRWAGLPRRRWLLLAVTAVVVVVAAVVGPAIVLGGRSTTLVTQAWAVQRHPDGTVTVTLRETLNPAGLQRALRTAGVTAIVRLTKITRFSPATRQIQYQCLYRPPLSEIAPGSVQQAVITPGSHNPAIPVMVTSYIIHPAAMPRGSAIFFTSAQSTYGGTSMTGYAPPYVLLTDQVPPCVRQK